MEPGARAPRVLPRDAVADERGDRVAAWSLFSKLKDGFSGADGPPKLETYALHLYGKLPIYKDFISSGLHRGGREGLPRLARKRLQPALVAPRGVQGGRDPAPHLPPPPSRREAVGRRGALGEPRRGGAPPVPLHALLGRAAGQGLSPTPSSRSPSSRSSRNGRPTSGAISSRDGRWPRSTRASGGRGSRCR